MERVPWLQHLGRQLLEKVQRWACWGGAPLSHVVHFEVSECVGIRDTWYVSLAKRTGFIKRLSRLLLLSFSSLPIALFHFQKKHSLFKHKYNNQPTYACTPWPSCTMLSPFFTSHYCLLSHSLPQWCLLIQPQHTLKQKKALVAVSQ